MLAQTAGRTAVRMDALKVRIQAAADVHVRQPFASRIQAVVTSHGISHVPYCVWKQVKFAARRDVSRKPMGQGALDVCVKHASVSKNPNAVIPREMGGPQSVPNCALPADNRAPKMGVRHRHSPGVETARARRVYANRTQRAATRPGTRLVYSLAIPAMEAAVLHVVTA